MPSYSPSPQSPPAPGPAGVQAEIVIPVRNPVDWIDDADSRVKVILTAAADLRGIARLGTGLARGTITVPALRSPQPPPRGGHPRRPGGLAGQLARFLLVGVTSTAAYVLLYLLLRGFLAAQAANAVSLLLTAAANTFVNRRVTFGIRGRRHAARHLARPDRVRRRPRPHLRRARRPVRDGFPARPGGRTDRSRRGQPHGHPGAVRALPELGVPRRPGW